MPVYEEFKNSIHVLVIFSRFQGRYQDVRFSFHGDWLVLHCLDTGNSYCQHELTRIWYNDCLDTIIFVIIIVISIISFIRAFKELFIKNNHKTNRKWAGHNCGLLLTPHYIMKPICQLNKIFNYTFTESPQFWWDWFKLIDNSIRW